MKKMLLNLLLLGTGNALWAQSVQVQIDITSARRTISPYIYGRNNSLSDDPGNPVSTANWQLYKDAGLNFFRENGGNDLTKYNWRLKRSSHPDWYNNVYAHDWDFAAQSLQQHIPSAQGMWGFQLIGQAALTNTHNFDDWDYNGSQWWTGTAQNLAGGGVVNPAGGSQATQNGNPALYLESWPADSTSGIIGHWFGSGGIGLDQTKIKYWNMDNEVEIWSSTHDDVMPTQLSAESFMQLYFAVAKKARALFPDIKLTGPVSPNEWQWFNWNNATVTGSDGKQYPWLQFFIKRVAEEQIRTGIRLLDVIDLHFYPSGSTISDVVQYHRVFFDSTYNFPEANGIHVLNGGWDPSIRIEDVFGRAQNWLNQYMGPGNGVSFAISETAVNLTDPNASAVWYASTLGEFMDHNVEYFSPWNWNTGMWETLHLYSRYNKTISVSATSSDEQNVSAYASASANNDSLTVVLVNRSQSQTKSVTVNLSNFVLANQAMNAWTLSNLPSGETFVSHTNNALKSSSVSPVGNTLQVSMTPMSITSLQLVGNQSVLPLTLVAFTAARNGDQVRLHFATADEQQIASYEIQRSPDGTTFTKIGSIPAAAATLATPENNYVFDDIRPLPALNEYRLRLIDRQGGSSYSRIVAIRLDHAPALAVYPNPVKGMVNIQVQARPGTVLLQVLDAAGRIVRTLELISPGSAVSTSIDVSDLAHGIYYVHAGSEIRSFMKQ
ncbi:MAG: glycoside hydrolase family 44 protein [Bacteroidota bacterium]|nr:glycoside hydrolase family 44 protein [Bacteroidota bacterium]